MLGSNSDCTYADCNENEVGGAIQEKIKEKAVRQEDLVIVNKLWPTCFEKKLLKEAFQKSLTDLKLDYLNHWPQGLQRERSYSPKMMKAISSPVKQRSWKPGRTWRNWQTRGC